MQNCAGRLRGIVESASQPLLDISATDAMRHEIPEKWSRKEIIGHLIDSASNNHGRFVRARLKDDLIFPGYDQDAWVRNQKYDSAPWQELVTFWRLFNLHLARIMEAVPEEVTLKACDSHNLDKIAWRPIPANLPATLGYFMNDYVDHLEHHLKQILPDIFRSE